MASIDVIIRLYESAEDVIAILKELFAQAVLPANTTLMISIHDFATGEKVSYNGNIKIHPASVKKTMYMLMFLEQVKQGIRSLDEVYTLTEEDKYGSPGSKVDGSGILQFKPAGTQLTWGELMGLMISISDNVATNLFIETLGKDRINARIRDYGLKDTFIVRKIRQMIPGNNHSNADDMNQVLVALESRQFIDGDLYAFAIDIMKKTINKERIGRHAPKDVIVANKTGTLDSIIGDSALLFFPHRQPLALTIFFAGVNHAKINQDEAEVCMGDLAEKIISWYY